MPHIVINDVGDPTQDRRGVIQEALDALDEAGGGLLSIGSGDYYIGPGDGVEPSTAGEFALQIGDNTTLELADDCRLIKRFKDPSLYTPLIRNKDWDAGNSNIRIVGGTLDVSDDPANIGRIVIFLKVTNLRMEDTKFVKVFDDSWNFTANDCNNVVLSGLDIDNGTKVAQDGLHFAGCQNVDIHDCRIISGDDAISLYNEPDAQTQDMIGVRISDCEISSRAANGIRLGVISGTDFKIRNVRIYDCTGTCAGGGVFIDNQIGSPGGVAGISDVEINGVNLDCSTNDVGSPAAPLAVRGAHRMTIANLTAFSPGQGALVLDSDDVDLINLKVLSPRAATQRCLSIAPITGDVTNIRVRGGYLTGSTNSSIVVGSPSYTVTNFEVSGVLIDGATQAGVEVYDGSGGMVSGNTIKNCASWGILEIAPSDSNVFLANRLLGNTVGGLFMVGPHSQAARNLTDASYPTIDSGGFRQTIDGWSKTGITGTLPAIEMTRAIGRFRAARDGSVTGLILTTTVNWASAGSMTATVFKKASGVAGLTGSSIGLTATIDSGSLIANRDATIQAEGVAAAQFGYGDELYIVIESSSWGAGATDAYCAVEIEC